MCGIIGIYKRDGIVAEDVEKFIEMFKQCELRGRDATGAFDSSMRGIKANVESSVFVETPKFKEWSTGVIGGHFIIGHCRQATRGNPSDNSNNHPIPVLDNGRKVYLVHNGTVECGKWDFDENKKDKEKQKTDTYIFANAIRYHIELQGGCGRLRDAVKLGFEDVVRSGSDSSVIVVADENEIVMCKSTGKPLVFQVVSDGYVVFASDNEILGPVHNYIDKKGFSGYKVEELNNHSIVSINVADGMIEKGFLETMPKPRPTKTVVLYDCIQPTQTCKTWTMDEHASSIQVSSTVAGKAYDDYNGYMSRKQRKKAKKNKKKKRIVPLVEKKFDFIKDDDMDEEDRIVLEEDDDTFDSKYRFCTDCTSCLSDDAEFSVIPRCEDLCFCGYYGYDVPVDYASKCDDFVRVRRK